MLWRKQYKKAAETGVFSRLFDGFFVSGKVRV